MTMAISPKVQINILYEAHLIQTLDKLNNNRYFRSDLLSQALEDFLEKHDGKGDDDDLF